MKYAEKRLYVKKMIHHMTIEIDIEEKVMILIMMIVMIRNINHVWLIIIIFTIVSIIVMNIDIIINGEIIIDLYELNLQHRKE